MGPHSLLTHEKIPVTQAIWQVLEIVMNTVILFTMLTAGFNGVVWYGACVLILWQAFEVAMNSWILVTMFKVGLKPFR